MKKRIRRPISRAIDLARPRCLKLEDLESRRLLAGDVLGPGNPAFRNEVQAEIRLTEVENSNIPRSERVLNNSLGTAESIPLGFDSGEYAAIDLRGELIEPNSFGAGISSEVQIPNVPRLEDGSILLANRVNFSDGVPIEFTGAFGDSVQGLNGVNAAATGGDGDYYELRNVRVGQVITGSVSGAASILVLYDAFGDVLATSDSTSPNQNNTNFVSYEVVEEDDYFFAVLPLDPAVGAGAFQLPLNPYDEESVFGGPAGNYTFTVGVNSADTDYYALQLNKGDILGINSLGATNLLSFYDASGNLVLQSGEDNGDLYPNESPLPRGGTASFATVINNAGTYYVGVNGFNFGRYALEFRLFRPEIESAPAGTTQILFLDFDGALFNPETVFGAANLRRVSGLDRYMSRWGLNDESDLIDRIIREVNENFNGDLKKINPEMHLEIRNSRDHADPYGLPYVSRVIVGGSVGETTIATLGRAQSIDIGNFDMEETAVVMLDGLSGSRVSPDSLNHYPIAPGALKADFVARGVANVISHEAGHFFGARHVNSNNFVSDIMDTGNPIEDYGVGDDLIFGTFDDVDVDFATDEFEFGEGLVGLQDSASMLANVLTTGRGGAGIGAQTTFTGLIFNDVNGNGVRDAGDIGVAGVRVFLDVNGDNQFGIDEPSALSNPAGLYTLPDVRLTGNEVRLAVNAADRLTSPALGRYLISDPARLSGTFDFGIQTTGGTSAGVDFGDAPASYGVASHAIVAGLSLGAFVDGEPATTDNDGSDDDGVTLSTLARGSTASASVTATSTGQSPGVLSGWIDFNRDGIFSASEVVVRDLLVNGSGSFSFTVPASASSGTTFARFRYGYERGIGPTGAAIAGEVEDYAVVISGTPDDGGGGTTPANAVNDLVTTQQGATAVAINVLANDTGTGTLTITNVGSPSQGGTVTINGTSLIYTPLTSFFGTETFTYTISNGTTTDTGLVSVTVEEVDNAFDLIRFRLETVNAAGEPITAASVGDVFTLNVYTQDLRVGGIGVFAAYLDVTFDDALVSAAGTVTFGTNYPAGQVPSGGAVPANPAGLFDEWGAFAGDTNQLGSDELLLYSIEMTAVAEGVVTFASNTADILPAHEVLLGDVDATIPANQIDYTSTSVTIVPGVEAFTPARNSLDVNGDGFVTARDALMMINEINANGPRKLEGAELFSNAAFFDVNGDHFISSADILVVLRHINQEVASSNKSVTVAAAVDAAFDNDDESDLFGGLRASA